MVWRVKIPELNATLASEDLSFEEKKEIISNLVSEHPAFVDYHGLTGNSALNKDEFNIALEEIYDYADENGIWLGLGLREECRVDGEDRE